MKKIIVLILVIFITNIPISCTDDCGGFTRMESRITELSASVGTYSASGFSTSTPTNFNNAAIEISIISMDYFEVAASIRKTYFSFINASYACSPPEPKPSQAIESILITSEASVYVQQKEFSAGENLNELFKITGYSYSNTESSIAEFIGNQERDLSLFGHAGDRMIFQLKDQPDSTINQTFTIDFVFSDGESITIGTEDFVVDN